MQPVMVSHYLPLPLSPFVYIVYFFLADIDECLESNGGCAEICNNLPGTHECACRKGYQLKESDGSCEGEWILRQRLPRVSAVFLLRY